MKLIVNNKNSKYRGRIFRMKRKEDQQVGHYTKDEIVVKENGDDDDNWWTDDCGLIE